ncbi:MAG: ATP-binding protein [Hyphomicrobiaceae bacterium]
MQLISADRTVGVFRGFRDGGLEFHADIALPYNADLHRRPMHGNFILIRLETDTEAVLGRIASFVSEGKLSTPSGEDFTIRVMRDRRDVPEDLREQYLKYCVNIRVLGVVRSDGGKPVFVPSHRRLPHVGSPVAFPSETLLQWLAGHHDVGAHIGHLALGEYIYDPQRTRSTQDAGMQTIPPEVRVHFDIGHLISRRSFVFARAGFGKSNLSKLLFSYLYKGQPETIKRRGLKVPVGTLIFDPDGEYFWPDDKGRPGFCDVPWLQDKLVVFTARQAPSAFYESFTAAQVRLDIRDLRPSDVLSIALAPDKQDQQNVVKLRSLAAGTWRILVDLIHRERNAAPIERVAEILNLKMPTQEAEALAARSNMTAIVGLLHDPSSQILSRLLEALSEGKLCVVDISQMRGQQGFVLAGLLLRQIFTRNQDEFTKRRPQTIPTIAVIEEAQSVLNDRATSAEPFVAWVKEGRKYDLGAVLITQQPGSIPAQILSQGDTWFIFHLLSAGDLHTLRNANAHFSSDILGSLLNEPIRGQGVFWSSAAGREYPISVRIRSFEAEFKVLDPGYDRPAVKTFATLLRARSDILRRTAESMGATAAPPRAEGDLDPAASESVPDIARTLEQIAVDSLRSNTALLERIRTGGELWGVVQKELSKNFESVFSQKDAFGKTYRYVAPALDAVFGAKNWKTEPNSTGKRVVKILHKPS